jgi:hypothetical protein
MVVRLVCLLTSSTMEVACPRASCRLAGGGGTWNLANRKLRHDARVADYIYARLIPDRHHDVSISCHHFVAAVLPFKILHILKDWTCNLEKNG